jgi:hypothetical protein
MNRAPIALCGLLCTLGSTLIAAGMAHDGSPCRISPRPQPRIGVQATAPSPGPLASYDPLGRWADPNLWREVNLVLGERRHETFVPTPVRPAAIAAADVLKPAPSKFDSIKAAGSGVSPKVGKAAASPKLAKKVDGSLPRLVRAAEMASQSDAILGWIAAQDGIGDGLPGIYVRGASKPLDPRVVDIFLKVAPKQGSVTPWTISLHHGIEIRQVFDSNMGFDGRGVRIARSAVTLHKIYGPETSREVVRGYQFATARIAGLASVADRISTVGSGLVDLGLAGGRQIDRTGMGIVSRIPTKASEWNRLIPGLDKPTEIGGKPAKVRSAQLPGKTKK